MANASIRRAEAIALPAAAIDRHLRALLGHLCAIFNDLTHVAALVDIGSLRMVLHKVSLWDLLLHLAKDPVVVVVELVSHIQSVRLSSCRCVSE